MDEIDFERVPAKALNISSRLRLAWFLNPEQALPSENGFARDYRGLAEQMDFQYNDIKNFQRNEDPTMKILEAWDARPNTTISQLIQFLENMGRHDVVQDLHPQFENDANVYLRSMKRSNEIPLQVPEVTSCHMQNLQFVEDLNILTRGDIRSGEPTYYDAYVCYADEDIRFVHDLAKYLESPAVGFKLFIRGRDLLAGHSEYETNIQLIKERCRRMLIILSPDFLRSTSCEFQASFAAGLAIEQRQRILIPIVLAPCEIPLVLRYVSKIDFTKADIQDWVWDRLISSLQDVCTSMFISSERNVAPKASSFPQLEPLDTSTPAITYPSTLTQVPVASDHSSVGISAISPCASSAISFPEVTINPSLVPAKTSPQPKQKRRFWWSPSLKGRFSAHNYSSSTTSISSSNATSGFHSQSDNVFDSSDVSTEVCSQDTSV